MPAIVSLCGVLLLLVLGLNEGLLQVKDLSQYHLMNEQIDSIRAKLSTEGNAKRAGLWGELGLTLQRSVSIFHQNDRVMNEEALLCFNKAIEFSARDVNLHLLHYRRAMLLRSMGRLAEAVASHDWVVQHALNPSDKAESLLMKGRVLIQWGHLEEAVEAIRAATAVLPFKLDAYFHLAGAMIELDLPVSELRSAYEQLEKLLARYEADPEAVRRDLLEVRTGAVVPVDEACPEGGAYWALFLLGDKLKDYSRAWQYLDTAHHLVRHSRPLVSADGIEREAAQMQTIMQIFNNELVPLLRRAGITGMATTTPIFIIGMMRSGSTLTETMLDSHPEIFGMGEDSVFNMHVNALRNDFVAAFHNPDQQQRVASMRLSVIEYGKMIERQMLDTARNSSYDGSSAAAAANEDPKHVVDKMLFNYRNLGFIELVFPNAVVLHTMRDPMDTIFSILKHKLSGVGFEWTMHEELVAAQYANYLEIIAHFRKVLPGRVVDVRYEELIQRPEEVMRRVVDKIGDIQWDDNILNFHSSQRIVHTPSMSQVRHKLYRGAIGSWRRYAKQLEPVRVALKKLLLDLERKGFELPYPNDINWELDPDWSGYQELGLEPAPESTVYAGKPVVGPADWPSVAAGTEKVVRSLSANSDGKSQGPYRVKSKSKLKPKSKSNDDKAKKDNVQKAKKTKKAKKAKKSKSGSKKNGKRKTKRQANEEL